MGVINLGALVEKLKKKLAASGFITSTDYASASTGGVIKTDTTYATDITTGGKLKAKEIAAESFSEANDAAFISKKTIDNLKTAGYFGGGSSGTWTLLLGKNVGSSKEAYEGSISDALQRFKQIVVYRYMSETEICGSGVLDLTNLSSAVTSAWIPVASNTISAYSGVVHIENDGFTGTSGGFYSVWGIS